MLRMYFTDFDAQMSISIHDPLYAGCEQSLEIFDRIAENSNSMMGFISEQGHTVQFSKYNKFVWLVEIPLKHKKGKYQIFLTPNKVKSLIYDLHEGFNPLKINGLMFEKNK